MVKTIIKESIIMILLCIAILLTFCVVFYNYIPSNKIVPSKVSYETPEEISNEMVAMDNRTEYETIIEQTIGVMTGDMKVYEQKKSYNPGKVDPFSVDTEVVSDGTDSNSVTDTNKTNTTQGTFYEDTGTK